MRYRLALLLLLLTSSALFRGTAAEQELTIIKGYEPGLEKPILLSVSGISGEALQTLQFDLYVQGFAFTNAEAAQYSIAASANGNFQARATDLISKNQVVASSYSGAALPRLVHRFVDDFVQKLGRKPIAQTRIAFKGGAGQGGNSEIYIADFDGRNAQAVTKDNTIVAAPCWVPKHSSLYYTSYKLNHADIFYHDLTSGSRKAFARYGGSNMSPAPSPEGSKVAIILRKDGWPDFYAGNSDGPGVTRLTKSPQDESSPCWSPDGRWICYASKERERRELRKISVSGGQPQTLSTMGKP